MAGRWLHPLRGAATPDLGLLRLLDAVESREPTSTGQPPPFRVSGDYGNLQLPSLGLAPHEAKIQLTGQKSDIPREDERDATSVQPTEPMPDRGKVILRLQLYN